MENQQKSFCSFLEFDKDKQYCIDKIGTVSLIHSTGHITVITKSGKEHKTTLTDLIRELRVEQTSEIVQTSSQIFLHIVTFRYTEKRSDEFEKIIRQTKIRIAERIDQPKIFKNTNSFEVTVQIDNVHADYSTYPKFLNTDSNKISDTR